MVGCWLAVLRWIVGLWWLGGLLVIQSAVGCRSRRCGGCDLETYLDDVVWLEVCECGGVNVVVWRRMWML